MFFCIADFFFLRFETSQAPTTNNSENRDRTNKQTDKKKTQKNSTMIDDRRLLKPANENKTKKHRNFPPMSTYNYSYTTTQNKKNQFQKNVQMMKPVSSERENRKR